MRPVSVLSLETIWCSLDAERNGASYDPRGDLVFGATVPHPVRPGVADWRTAIWEVTTDPHRYAIGTQVGPAVCLLAAGVTYGYWVRWTDNPDAPVVFSGTFRAY